MGQIDFQPLDNQPKIDFQPAADSSPKYNLPGGSVADSRDLSQTALESGANMLTGNYLPAIEAKMQPLTDRAANFLKGTNDPESPMSQLTENGPDYIKARDANAARIAEQSKRNPKASFMGSAGGLAASVALTPEIKAAQGLGILGSAAKGAAYGGAYGALTNPGDEPGKTSDLQLLERAKNAGVGTLTGGAIGALVNPKTLNAAGETIYDSGIKKIMQRADQYNKDDIGALLRSKGIWGSAGSIADQVDLAKGPIWQQVQNLAAKADASGGKFSMQEAMQPAIDKIKQIRAEGLPNQQPIADQLEKQVAAHLKMEAPTPEVPAVTKQVYGGLDENGWPISKQEVVTPGSPGSPGKVVSTPTALKAKSDIYNMMGDATWNDMKHTPMASQVTKPLAMGLKNAAENNVGRALGPEAQDAFTQANENYGKLATVDPAAQQAARIEANKNFVTSLDGPLALHNFPMYLAKKAADIAKLTATRTGTGYGLTSLAQRPETVDAINRTLVNPQLNPWEQTK